MVHRGNPRLRPVLIRRFLLITRASTMAFTPNSAQNMQGILFLAEGFGFSWPIRFQIENHAFSSVEDRSLHEAFLAFAGVTEQRGLDCLN